MNVMRRYAMLISTTILCLLFLKLTSNYSNRFKEVEHSYESGISANLIRGSKFAGAISSMMILQIVLGLIVLVNESEE